MKISPAAKVGILTILSIVILIFGIMWLKGRSISAGERIEIQFQDVDGMRPGSAVQMMGIRIGQVEDVIPVIEKDSSYVKVKFVITEPNVTLPQASIISIQQSGIIGEKFLEITPPQIQTIFLPITSKLKVLLAESAPVKLLVSKEYMPIGEVKIAEIVDSRTVPQSQRESIKTPFVYKIGYIITKPGIIVPDNTTGTLEIVSGGNNKSYELRLTPPNAFLAQAFSSCGKYTIIEPMRLKEFFDIQLKSAVALQETNDKINNLLSEESINDLKATIKNTKELTSEASKTLNQVTLLLSSSKSEIDSLLILATQLSNKMIVLSDNINNVISDPTLKNNLIETTTSIQKSAKSISVILDDPKLKETISLVNNSAKDLSEITSYINGMSKDQKIKNKLDNTLTTLNTSLAKLSITLDSLNNINDSDKEKLKLILDDSSEISKNLKQFSDKLNKRFLLFRLLF